MPGNRLFRGLSVFVALGALAWPTLAEAHYNGRYHRHSYYVEPYRPRPAVEVVSVLGLPVLLVPVRREPVYRSVRVYRRRY